MEPRFRAIERWAPPLLLSLLLLGLGGPSLRQYNVTWDEALGDLFFGQRYWSFYTTLDPAYLDFFRDPYPPGYVPDLSASEWRHEPAHFYGVGGTLAAATSDLVYRKLGWLDPYDGYHAVNLWLAVVFVFAFHRFLLRRFGAGVAVLAPLLLFLCPRIVCDLMANIKDFPSMIFFGVALMAFLTAYEAGSFGGVLGAGVLWGLAISAKSNGLFIAPIVGLLFLTGGLPPRWKSHSRALLALSIAGVLGLGTLILMWPYTWADPPYWLSEHLSHLATRSELMGPENIAPPLANILYTTPIPFLLLFALGVWPLARRVLRRERAALLLLFWIVVVIGRLFLPGAVNFDGVRHFLELFPPMAAVAALGLTWSLERVSQLLPSAAPRAWLRTAGVALALVPMVVSLVRTHPLEIAYWNGLIGGLRGAHERRMAQAGDYWGASYRLGLDWLNENAAHGSALAVPLIEHAVRLVAPERLRPDLELLAVPDSKVLPRSQALAFLREEASRRDVYVMFVRRDESTNGLMDHFMRNEKPIRTWDLDGVPVLLLYRYAPAG